MIAIKGFDGYYIDMDKKTVYKTNKYGKLEPARTDKVRHYISMWSKDDKRQHFYMIGRIMFAVLNDMDIRKIPKDIYITLDQSGNPYIVENCIQFMKTPYRGMEDIITDLKEQIRLANLLINAYQSEDYTPVINEFYKVRQDMEKYIIYRGYAMNEESINELIGEAIDRIATALVAKRLRVGNVKSYFKYIIRTIVSEKVKIKKSIYNDYLLYLHTD